MNVSLTDHLEEFVAAKVRTGQYTSASEVVREGLRLLQEQDQLRQLRLEQLRKDVAVGLEQLERGEYVDADEVFDRIHRKSQQRREGKNK